LILILKNENLQKKCQNQDGEIEELKFRNEKYSNENTKLNKLLIEQKKEFENLFNELNSKVKLSIQKN
jgi:hypothetical protein